MDTNGAAAKACVSVATIRTWCRIGAVAATKHSGRWNLDETSLDRRIALGIRRPQRSAKALNLSATYTYVRPGDTTPTTITPKVTDRIRDGRRIIAITDAGDRLHALTVLEGSLIGICDQPRTLSRMFRTRDEGRLNTNFPGAAGLSPDAVLDLAERLRVQLLD